MSRQELLELPVVVDLETAARALRIGRSTAYRLAAAGEFPVRVIQTGGKGGSYRVPTAALIALIDGPPTTAPTAQRESSDGQDGDQ